MTDELTQSRGLHAAGAVIGTGLLAIAIYYERYGVAAGMAVALMLNLAALMRTPQKP